MSDNLPKDSKAVPGRREGRRRWRRLAWGMLLLILLLLLLHRPLGHWGMRYWGSRALAKLGVSSEWKTSGSLVGGLAIERLKLAGDEASGVESVTLRHAALDYDLLALGRGEVGAALQRLVVEDLVVELDFSRPRPPRPRGEKKGNPPQLPRVVWPEMRIEHVTLRMRLPGKRLVVEDFSLVLDPAKPGWLEVGRLEVPGMPVLEKLRGTTRWEPQRLILEQVALGEGLGVDRLVLDIAGLVGAEAAVEVEAHQGAARAVLVGRSGGWFGEPTAEAKLVTSGLEAGTLAFWGLPLGGVDWQAGELEISAQGPVRRPDQLALALRLGKSALQVQEMRFEGLELRGRTEAGRFLLERVAAAVGDNQLEARGSTALPSSWGGLARAAGDLELTLRAPRLEQLGLAEAGLSGQAEVEGRLAFAGGHLTEAKAAVKSAGLRVQGVPVESGRAELRLDGGALVLDSAVVRLDQSNGLTASGRWELESPRRLEATWRVEALDLATVPVEARAGLPWPTAGRVLSEGKASGLLEEWQAGEWGSLEGKGSLEATGLKVGEAALEALRWQAEAKAGAVELAEGLVRLDGANQLEASGRIDLADAARALRGKLALRLPDVARASAWSTQFGGPKLLGGQVGLDWQGEGQLNPLGMKSEGSATVAGLRVEGLPEVLGFSAALTQSGAVAEFTRLRASAGPWRAEGRAHWDGFHLEVPQMQAFVGKQRLADLRLRVPWHAGAVPPDAPLSLQFKVVDLPAASLASALGRALPVEGRLQADATFEGTLEALQGLVKVAATEVKPVPAVAGSRLAAAAASLTARLERGQLSVEGKVQQPPLAPLELTAALPVDLVGLLANPASWSGLPLAGRLRLPTSPLGFLPSWVPVLREVQGTAAVDFGASGTLGHPIWQGSAAVQVAQAAFVAGSLPTVRDLKLQARVDARRFVLDEATVMLAGGRLRLEGGADLERPDDPLLDFKLNADEILVLRDENLSLRANADITCQGRVSAAAVRGQIGLVRGRVFKEIEFLPLSLPNDLPPPPPSATLGRQGPPTLPAPFDRWNFDLAIKTRDPIRLMGNVARGNAVADLRWAGPGARPELTGKVRLEDMWIKLPFSRLTITEGELSFTREQPYDPQINIAGESITGSRTVEVFVQGRALDPKVRLTANPPLPEGEIAALLATGVTTSDLTSSKDEAAGRAAMVLLKQTYRHLFHRDASAAADDEPPRLSFDFSVFGSDPERRGVSAIYELSPRWRVVGRVGETGNFRGLLHYLIRFR